MMKLLLAVIATCALVVSPTCIKIKHQLRSNAPTIHVLISNGNTQMTSQVGRNGSHRFITDNLSSMTLAPAGSQTITLSYDQIFPITDAAVCTEVHPLSAGGCADGVCCKISISMYTITDAIIMTARVNNRKADGNPQFWKCEQEIQVPGVTNTELSPEELVTDILHGEAPGAYCTSDGGECGDPDDKHLECISNACECVFGYVQDGAVCRDVAPGDVCTTTGLECGFQPTTHLECSVSDNVCACDSTSTVDGNKCACKTGYVADDDVCRLQCDSVAECGLSGVGNAVCTTLDEGKSGCKCGVGFVSKDGGENCVGDFGCTLGNDQCSDSGTCPSGYYGDGFNCHAKQNNDVTCGLDKECKSNYCKIDSKNGNKSCKSCQTASQCAANHGGSAADHNCDHSNVIYPDISVCVVNSS